MIKTKKNKDVKITVYDALCGTGKSVAAIKDINATDDRVIVITPIEGEMKRYARECPRLSQPVGRKGGGKTESSRELIKQGLSFVTSHELAKLWTLADYESIKAQSYRLIMDETIEFIGPYDPCGEKDRIYEKVQKNNDIPSSLKADILNALVKSKSMTPEDIKAFVKGFCILEPETGLLDLRAEEDENGEPVKIKSAKFEGLIELVKEHRLVYDNGCLLKIMPPEFLRAFTDIKILTYMFDKLPSASYMHIFDFRFSDGYITDEMTFTDDYCSRSINLINYDNLITIWDETVDKNMVKLNAPGSNKFALSSTAYKEKMSKDELKQVFRNMHNWATRYAHLTPSQMFFISYNCAVDTESKRCFYSSTTLKRKYEKRHLACNIKATNNYSDCVGIAYLINRYSDVSMLNYCKNKGYPYSQDAFATSEMLQALFRSALRNGEQIDVYIPSSRMRSLLRTWIDEQTAILNSYSYDENGVLIIVPFS